MRTPSIRNYARIGLFLVMSIPLMAQAAQDSDTQDTVQSLLHILDYISVDYPGAVNNGQIMDAGEYAEQREFSLSLDGLVSQLSASVPESTLKSKIKSLQHTIEAQGSAETVALLCRKISQSLIDTYRVTVTPLSQPSLESGKQLYRDKCIACHGATGQGDGPSAEGLEPPPANFTDRQRQAQRSLYSLYSTLTLGVNGTAMPAFIQLSDAERWDLAFFISGFYTNPAEIEQGEQAWRKDKNNSEAFTLNKLALLTPAEALNSGDPLAVSKLVYLRAHPDELSTTPTQAIAISLYKLTASFNAYVAGQHNKAYKLAASSYLDGFELTEGALKIIAPKLRKRVESSMADYRQGIKSRISIKELTTLRSKIVIQLGEVSDVLKQSSESIIITLLSSILILLREGLEAILVLASIAGLLAKANRSHHMGYIHMGWGSALVLGIITWVIAHNLIDISGVGREMAEGIAALVASAMLLYVGFWLHNKSNSNQWRQFLHGRLDKQVGKKALWGLAAIAFLAVYREVLETVLFYETFWLESSPHGHQYIVMGFLIAAALLVAISWMIFKFSLRLPLRQFFIVNATLLFILSIVYSGKGVTALQEAGKISSSPINFPEVDLLGIYPTLESLGIQAVILFSTLAWLTYQRTKSTPAT